MPRKNPAAPTTSHKGGLINLLKKTLLERDSDGKAATSEYPAQADDVKSSRDGGSLTLIHQHYTETGETLLESTDSSAAKPRMESMKSTITALLVARTAFAITSWLSSTNSAIFGLEVFSDNFSAIPTSPLVPLLMCGWAIYGTPDDVIWRTWKDAIQTQPVLIQEDKQPKPASLQSEIEATSKPDMDFLKRIKLMIGVFGALGAFARAQSDQSAQNIVSVFLWVPLLLDLLAETFSLSARTFGHRTTRESLVPTSQFYRLEYILQRTFENIRHALAFRHRCTHLKNEENTLLRDQKLIVHR